MRPAAINDLITQLQAAAAAAKGRPASAAHPDAATPQAGFAQALKGAIGEVNETQQRALDLARRFETGAADVPLHEVMLSQQKANIAFQGAVQVRNRLVQAYHDIMNMPV